MKKQLIKYVFVGIFNTAAGYLTFSLLIACKLHYTLAVFLSCCIGILRNFKTTGSLVFENKNNKLIGRFILVYASIYLINISIIKVMLNFSSNLYFNGAIASILCAPISFTINKKWVFSKNSKEKLIAHEN